MGSEMCIRDREGADRVAWSFGAKRDTHQIDGIRKRKPNFETDADRLAWRESDRRKQQEDGLHSCTVACRFRAPSFAKLKDVSTLRCP